jgi:hypothetical protein
MCRAAVLSLCVVLCIGCSRKPQPEKFMGEPANKRVWFDLVGEWDVFRYTTAEREAEVKSGKRTRPDERYDDKWTLKRVGDSFQWVDDHSGRSVDLCTSGDKQWLFVSDQSKDTPPFWFINDVRFGMLMMTGSDDQLYTMIRREGGQDAPHLVYP